MLCQQCEHGNLGVLSKNEKQERPFQDFSLGDATDSHGRKAY